MSRAAVKWVAGLTGLSRSQMNVMEALARLAGRDGSCAKTQAFIAEKVRLKERRVREILAELEGLALIVRERRAALNGRQAANLIRLQICSDQPAISTARPTGNPTGVGQPAKNAALIYTPTPNTSAADLPAFPTRKADAISVSNDNVITFPLVGGIGR